MMNQEQKTAGIEWIDGFETGRVSGVVEGQSIVFDNLVDGAIALSIAGLTYLVVKGFSDYLSERWAADHDNTSGK